MAFWGSNHAGSEIQDPKRKFRWMVQITNYANIARSTGQNLDSIESGEIWYAKTVSKPSFQIQAAEHKYLNHTFYYPGGVTWQDVTMTLVDPRDPDQAASLSQLIEIAGYQVPGNLNVRNTMSKSSATSALGNFIITQLDADGNGTEKWTLYNAFITDVKYGDLAYGDENLVEMSLTLKYDWAKCDVTDVGSFFDVANPPSQ